MLSATEERDFLDIFYSSISESEWNTLWGKVADGLNGGISYVAHASSEALAHGASCCTYKASGSLFELDIFCLLRVVIEGA